MKAKRVQYGKKKKTVKRRVIALVLLLLFLIILLLCYLNFIVNPLLLQTTEAQVRSITQKAMSSAVYSVIAESDYYDELINIKYDTNGNVSMVNANTLEVNLLSRKISSLAQNLLENMTSGGVDIHLGAFSGIMLLANMGPNINMKITPIGTISTSFRSEFVTAGINQTNHRIYIKIKGTVAVVLPTASPQVEANTEVLVTESVVIGQIPDTYLQSSYLDEMLNLVP